LFTKDQENPHAKPIYATVADLLVDWSNYRLFWPIDRYAYFGSYSDDPNGCSPSDRETIQYANQRANPDLFACEPGLSSKWIASRDR
jgi:hypothetical protein